MDVCGPVHSLWTPSLSFLYIHNRRESRRVPEGWSTETQLLFGTGLQCWRLKLAFVGGGKGLSRGPTKNAHSFEVLHKLMYFGDSNDNQNTRASLFSSSLLVLQVLIFYVSSGKSHQMFKSSYKSSSMKAAEKFVIQLCQNLCYCSLSASQNDRNNTSTFTYS